VVADIKTSKRVYPKHKKQLAAYAYAAEHHPDMDLWPVDRGEIYRVNPDKQEAEVVRVDDLEQYWDEFARMSRNM